MLQRPGESHAIWHFWEGPERRFAGWYVNFQRPFVRTEAGYDTADLELDIWLPAEGGWEWKDAELLPGPGRRGPLHARSRRRRSSSSGDGSPSSSMRPALVGRALARVRARRGLAGARPPPRLGEGGHPS